MSGALRLGAFCVATAFILVAGCGNAEDKTSRRDAAGRDLPRGGEPVELDPADFTIDIDNLYWPMPTGRRWTYRETDEEGRMLTVVVTVTSQTRKIANGITARVVRDTVTEDGELIEDTLDWYAQDRTGNVWYLGEDTAEFRSGRIVSKQGSWEAGVGGGQAGIAVPADPADDQTYRQEYDEGKAEDNGEVLGVREKAEVPAGHYDKALLTKDTSTLEPALLEYKLYAPNVGPVLALGISGGFGREELIRMDEVDAETARAAGTTPLGQRYHQTVPR